MNKLQFVYTSDVVHVVRCRYCKWRNLDNCPMEFYFDCHPADDDCFCAMGERESNGEGGEQ